MQTALRMETTILPGHRLEISDPELPEGARGEVIVVLPEKPKLKVSMLEFLESLPRGQVRAASRRGRSMNGTSGWKKRRGNVDSAHIRPGVPRRPSLPPLAAVASLA